MRLGRGWWIVCTLAPLLAPGGAAAKDAPPIRIVSISPSRNDTLICCTLRTLGLPDAATRETLASGLPSALVVAIERLDTPGGHRGEILAEIRIEPDLWTRTFVLRTPLAEHRVRTIEEIASLLAELGPLPVARIRSVSPNTQIKIRARLAVYSLAPAEAHRVHAILGGDTESGGSDRQEVSVNIGSLIRYFLRHGENEEWVCEAVSPIFDPDTLSITP